MKLNKITIIILNSIFFFIPTFAYVVVSLFLDCECYIKAIDFGTPNQVFGTSPNHITKLRKKCQINFWSDKIISRDVQDLKRN